MKYYSAASLSENIHITPEGYLICLGVPIARAGELVYGRHEVPITPGAGSTVVSREVGDIHAPETIASFEGKPVTLHHPMGGDFVTPENWRKLAVGIVQHVRPGTGEDADKLLADLLITDSAAIIAVQSKALREVSCGYDADFVEVAPGLGKQTNIIGNHVALVYEGRCGSECAIVDHVHNQGGQDMKLKERLLAIFGKALDEAALPDTDSNGNAGGTGQAADTATAAIRDEVAAIGKRVDDEVGKIGTRLGTMEAALAKLLGLESLDGTGKPAVVGDGKAADALCTDADTIARAEILAPGIVKSKDVARKSLDHALGQADTKDMIAPLMRGKGLDTMTEDEVGALLVSASELVKASRRAALAKHSTIDNLPSIKPGAMTPEKVNEINAKQYAGR